MSDDALVNRLRLEQAEAALHDAIRERNQKIEEVAALSGTLLRANDERDATIRERDEAKQRVEDLEADLGNADAYGRAALHERSACAGCRTWAACFPAFTALETLRREYATLVESFNREQASRVELVYEVERLKRVLQKTANELDDYCNRVKMIRTKSESYLG